MRRVLNMKKSVLFLCTHNSARSQMAEGLLRHFHDDITEVYSAGTVATIVHPLAVQVMAEIGIDISGQRSKSLEEFRNGEFDLVVTVCDTAREACPFFPGKLVIHRDFPDPAAAGGSEAEKQEIFRMVRDEIRIFIDEEIMKMIQ